MKWLTWVLGIAFLLLVSLVTNFIDSLILLILFSIFFGILTYFIIRIGYLSNQFKKIFYFFTGILSVFNISIYVVIMQLNKQLHELTIAAREAGTGSMMGLYSSVPLWALIVSIVLFLVSGLLTRHLITHFVVVKKNS